MLSSPMGYQDYGVVEAKDMTQTPTQFSKERDHTLVVSFVWIHLLGYLSCTLKTMMSCCEEDFIYCNDDEEDDN